MQTDRHFHSYRNATTTLTKLKKKKTQVCFQVSLWWSLTWDPHICIYIYICVTDSSAIISTAKCGTPKLQAHCSVQFSMLRHAYMLYVYYQRKRRGKQTPCFCLKGNKALSLAMGPQGPQCVVRVTWL